MSMTWFHEYRLKMEITSIICYLIKTTNGIPSPHRLQMSFCYLSNTIREIACDATRRTQVLTTQDVRHMHRHGIAVKFDVFVAHVTVWLTHFDCIVTNGFGHIFMILGTCFIQMHFDTHGNILRILMHCWRFQPNGSTFGCGGGNKNHIRGKSAQIIKN